MSEDGFENLIESPDWPHTSLTDVSQLTFHDRQCKIATSKGLLHSRSDLVGTVLRSLHCPEVVDEQR